MDRGTRSARWIGRILGWPLEVRDREEVADAIVVLGAPLRPDGQLSGVSEERVRTAVELWRRGFAPVLCITGGGPGRIIPGKPREADVMAARARELGVPDEALRVERESLSTAENARRSAELLAAEGRTRVWLVTQPFHTRRARAWFRRAGLAARAWYAEDSIQYRLPRHGLRWVTAEYGAWLRMWAWDARLFIERAARPGRGRPSGGPAPEPRRRAARSGRRRA
jgi:uncharacterized SAM-binding protein YcdF (DUF218 family)